jgi:hypothetical protein
MKDNGCLNVLEHDLKSIVTNYGTHERVVACQPDNEGVYCRCDLIYGLPEPSIDEILVVMRKDQNIKGKWKLKSREVWNNGKNIDYQFSKQ